MLHHDTYATPWYILALLRLGHLPDEYRRVFGARLQPAIIHLQVPGLGCFLGLGSRRFIGHLYPVRRYLQHFRPPFERQGMYSTFFLLFPCGDRIHFMICYIMHPCWFLQFSRSSYGYTNSLWSYGHMNHSLLFRFCAFWARPASVKWRTTQVISSKHVKVSRDPINVCTESSFEHAHQTTGHR